MGEAFEYSGAYASVGSVLRDPSAQEETKIISFLRLEDKLALIFMAAVSPIKEKKPKHIFIHGKSGTGKTTFVKHTLKASRNMAGLASVYVNCHEHKTPMAGVNPYSVPPS